MLQWALEMRYMGAYPGVGACLGHYSILTLFYYRCVIGSKHWIYFTPTSLMKASMLLLLVSVHLILRY